MKRIASIRSSVFILLFISLFSTYTAAADQEKEKKNSSTKFVNLSLYHPVSLYPDKNLQTSFSLSLLYGRSGRVAGLDLSAGLSAVGEKLSGIQICGLMGVVGDQSAGVQLAGLASICGESGSGLQAAGLFTVTGDQFAGVQLGGLFAISGKSHTGVQAASLLAVSGETFQGVKLSGLLSVSGESGQGLQGAGLINVVGGSMKGLMASGLLNVCGKGLSGAQIGMLNVSEENHGVQVGLINYTDDGNGLQLGLVNISKSGRTFPFGLINLSRRQGSICMTAWSDSLVPINLGARFNFRRIYTVLGIGMQQYGCSDATFSCHIRYGIRFASDWSADLDYSRLDHSPLFSDQDEEKDKNYFRLRLNHRLISSHGFEVTLGAGTDFRIDRHTDFTGKRLHPMISLQLDFPDLF